ncbi:MAG: small, acid-soluble spore protein, alpha/beta type [Tyzzerella sp.]|nr:small, acid-soluble spore protein, alpha/beta type [Tyzzerella sp.]
MPSQKKKTDLNEKLKYEIAEELGLLDKVLEGGWRSLTSKETGRIGGLITKKRRELQNEKEEIS